MVDRAKWGAAAGARGGRAKRFGLSGAAVIVALTAAAAAPQTGAAQTGGAEAAEGGESFGQTVGRVFSDAWSRSTDWLDPDAPTAEMCLTLSSEEPLEDGALKTFSAAVREAWEPPAPQAGGPDQAIALEVCLGPEQRSLRRPRLLRPVGALEPEQSVALLAALAAVEAAAPYSDPGAASFPWRRVVVLFDTHQGVGAAAIGARPLEPGDADPNPDAAVTETPLTGAEETVE